MITSRTTCAEWKAGRRRRRELGGKVAPGPCGRTTSRDDARLRATFNGQRNLPFAQTEGL